MAERDLQIILQKLKSPSTSYQESSSLLSKAKLTLLKLNALTPQPSTPSSILSLAREVFETGALVSIRAKDPAAFTRYVHQLTPYYELSADKFGGGAKNSGEKNKITGLYLLLLLTQGNYAGFHTELEGLELRGEMGGKKVEEDRYLGYPIKLERWLMEGSYDLVWRAMEGGKLLPSEEYGVFSEILINQIRSEIASSSETAYPSLPISSTKNLLFLPSEGAVVEFAQHRGWLIEDGRIYFPNQKLKAGVNVEAGEVAEEKELSMMAIENTLGYARELETIV